MSDVPHIPVLRRGEPYRSVETALLRDFRDGAPLARISQANSGLIARDLSRQADLWQDLQALSFEQAMALCADAADRFLHGTLAVGEIEQTPEDFARAQSATTAMPEAMCRANMEKIHFMMANMPAVLKGLSGQDDLCDDSFAIETGGRMGFAPRGRCMGVVLPNNSPGVHALWIPALALRIPLALRPGSQEPWTPYRIVAAFQASGYPGAAFNLYPSDHGGGNALLVKAERGMVFGDARTTERWAATGRVEVHGPGISKVLLDEAATDPVDRYLDVIVRSVTLNGGRSCVNASAVWAAARGRELAEALAQRLAAIVPRGMGDPEAALCGFANPAMAEAIDGAVEAGLSVPGAEDVTARYRQGERRTTVDGTEFLQPTVVYCDSPDHPLAQREFLFPYVAVVEAPVEAMPAGIGPSLVVTALVQDAAVRRALHLDPHIPRLNLGPVPTCAIDWTQPHEGNLFEHLFHRRVCEVASA